MDILLISTPVANFGQCSSGLSVLTAYLRAKGFEARQWDLAIEAFHHFHSPEQLSRCLEVLERAGVGNVPEPKDINGRTPDEQDIRVVARRVIAEIDAAKEALRREGIERDHATMRWAFQTIADAGVVMTAASLGRYEHDFRHFGIPDAFRSYAALEDAIEDPARNPY